MNFRFQDEKETWGHELLGDTCSEQGPMPKKGPNEQPENRGPEGGRHVHSPIPQTFTRCVHRARLCAEQQACANAQIRGPVLLGVIIR